MNERVQLCQDAQTEFDFLRVNSIHDILRVHGHTILPEGAAVS